MFDRFAGSILKFFFDLLYNQFAWAYDWVADIVSIGRWKSWVYSIIPYLGDAAVLEIGCGPGHLLSAYSNQGGVIFGLDASQQMVRKAGRNLSRRHLAKNLIFAMAQDLPFRDQAFPVVAATFPSNDIFEEQTIAQIYRVLKNGGQLLILPAAWITGSTVLDRTASWLFTITGESPDRDCDALETRYKQPIAQLSDKGFSVSLEIIPCKSSKVLLIRCVKQLPGS